MRCIPLWFLLLAALVCATAPTVQAVETTTPDEAWRVAAAWVRLITDARGEWAGSSEPGVVSVVPVERAGRLVGYLAEVEPEGWVVVPLYRVLAPVKAYAEEGRLDPTAAVGLPDLVSLSLVRSLDVIEDRIAKAGGDAAQSLGDLLGVDHTADWSALLSGSMAFPAQAKDARQADGVIPGGNYQMGDVLLTSAWTQGSPYNNELGQGVEWDPETETWVVACDHVLVGCVAVVGAQIARYWNWPPAGSGSGFDDPYDWANMPDTINVSSPAVQIDAVAELSAEVGIAADLDYGCERTGGYIWEWYDRDLEDALTQNFRYNPDSAARRDRIDFLGDDGYEWFALIKAILNSNIPIPYAVPDHAIVVDGWQEVGTTPICQYHVNYGWAGGGLSKPGWEGYTSTNTWITLDQLPGSTPFDEFLVEDIVPDNTIFGDFYLVPVSGVFDDAYVAVDVVVGPVQPEQTEILFTGDTQFLPGMTLTCENSPDNPVGPVRLAGSPADPAWIHARRGIGEGIRIHDGDILLHHGGRLKLH